MAAAVNHAINKAAVNMMAHSLNNWLWLKSRRYDTTLFYTTQGYKETLATLQAIDTLIKDQKYAFFRFAIKRTANRRHTPVQNHPSGD